MDGDGIGGVFYLFPRMIDLRIHCSNYSRSKSRKRNECKGCSTLCRSNSIKKKDDAKAPFFDP